MLIWPVKARRRTSGASKMSAMQALPIAAVREKFDGRGDRDLSGNIGDALLVAIFTPIGRIYALIQGRVRHRGASQSRELA